MNLPTAHLSPSSDSSRLCVVPMFSPLAEDKALCTERIGDVVRQLWRGTENGGLVGNRSWNDTLGGLLHNLEEGFHGKFRRQSPWVIQMLGALSGSQAMNLKRLELGFSNLWEALELHIRGEEVLLFPLLRRIGNNPQRRVLLLGPVFSGLCFSMLDRLNASAQEVERRQSAMAELLVALEPEAVREESLSCLWTVLEGYLQSLRAILDLEMGELYPRVSGLFDLGGFSPICD